jgi:hypothetical protein
MPGNRTYVLRRAAQERSAAQNATPGRARKAHEELADRYQKLVRTPDRSEASQNA